MVFPGERAARFWKICRNTTTSCGDTNRLSLSPRQLHGARPTFPYCLGIFFSCAQITHLNLKRNSLSIKPMKDFSRSALTHSCVPRDHEKLAVARGAVVEVFAWCHQHLRGCTTLMVTVDAGTWSGSVQRSILLISSYLLIYAGLRMGHSLRVLLAMCLFSLIALTLSDA